MMILRCYDSDNPGFLDEAQLSRQLCSSKSRHLPHAVKLGMPSRV